MESTTQTTRKRVTEIESIVLAHFVATRTGLTTEQIAEQMGVSPSTVRKYVEVAAGVRMAEEYVTTYSRSYPSMEHGCVRKFVFYPTAGALVEEIRRLRERTAYPSDEEDAGDSDVG